MSPETPVDGAEEAVTQLLPQLQLWPGQLPGVRSRPNLPLPALYSSSVHICKNENMKMWSAPFFNKNFYMNIIYF